LFCCCCNGNEIVECDVASGGQEDREKAADETLGDKLNRQVASRAADKRAEVDEGEGGEEKEEGRRSFIGGEEESFRGALTPLT